MKTPEELYEEHYKGFISSSVAGAHKKGFMSGINVAEAEYAELIHYPRCWDTAAYPTLAEAVWEALSWAGCSECNKP